MNGSGNGNTLEWKHFEEDKNCKYINTCIIHHTPRGAYYHCYSHSHPWGGEYVVEPGLSQPGLFALGVAAAK
jgi:hypothetical protein